MKYEKVLSDLHGNKYDFRLFIEPVQAPDGNYRNQKQYRENNVAAFSMKKKM